MRDIFKDMIAGEDVPCMFMLNLPIYKCVNYGILIINCCKISL